MSESKFINVYDTDLGYTEFATLEGAQSGASSSRPRLGTIELVDGTIKWHPNPDMVVTSPPSSAAALSDLTDAEIREAREVIRVARVLKGGGA